MACHRELPGGGIHFRLVVCVVVSQGLAASQFRNGGGDIGQGVDGMNILRHQGGDIPATPSLPRSSGANQQQVAAHGADPIHHRFPGTVANGQHGNHRGHANHDAQQRQGGTEEVAGH